MDIEDLADIPERPSPRIELSFNPTDICSYVVEPQIERRENVYYKNIQRLFKHGSSKKIRCYSPTDDPDTYLFAPTGMLSTEIIFLITGGKFKVNDNELVTRDRDYLYRRLRSNYTEIDVDIDFDCFFEYRPLERSDYIIKTDLAYNDMQTFKDMAVV